MKKLPSLLLAGLLLAILPAQADVTLVQQVVQEAAGQSKEMTITTKIKGQNARMDIAGQLSNIYDMTTGDMISLAHQQKAIMKIPADKLKEMQKIQAERAPATEPEPLKATGAKETINGFACEEYTSKIGDLDLTLWMTKDAEDAKTVMADLNKISNGHDPVANALLKLDSSGFPVRTVVNSPQGKITSTLVSIKKDPLADADFQAPTDYKEVSLPGMP